MPSQSDLKKSTKGKPKQKKTGMNNCSDVKRIKYLHEPQQLHTNNYQYQTKTDE